MMMASAGIEGRWAKRHVVGDGDRGVDEPSDGGEVGMVDGQAVHSHPIENSTAGYDITITEGYMGKTSTTCILRVWWK